MEKLRLGEICEIVSGTTPKTSCPEYWDGDIDWITPAELSDDTYIVDESVRKITQKAVSATGLKPFPAGTVILSSRAPIGKVAIAGKEMYCNQGFKNLICSEKISNVYLYWFLKGNKQYLNSLGRGATFKEISKSIVEDIEIALPHMDEQLRRAESLKKCWDIINLRKQELKRLDELVKAQFVEMFGEWNKSNTPEPLKNYLDEITYGFTNPMPDAEEGPWKVTAKDIVDGRVNFSTARKTTLEAFGDLTAKSKPILGDVLLTKDGTLGRVAVVEDEKICVNQSVAILRCNERLIPKFLMYLLQMPDYQHKMLSNSGGGTIKHIYITKVDKMNVMIPQLEKQRDFLEFVDQLDKSKAIVQKSIDEVQMLFDSLMQKYFE